MHAVCQLLTLQRLVRISRWTVLCCRLLLRCCGCCWILLGCRLRCCCCWVLLGCLLHCRNLFHFRHLSTGHLRARLPLLLLFCCLQLC
jgi:hypothetical protein